MYTYLHTCILYSNSVLQGAKPYYCNAETAHFLCKVLVNDCERHLVDLLILVLLQSLNLIKACICSYSRYSTYIQYVHKDRRWTSAHLLTLSKLYKMHVVQSVPGTALQTCCEGLRLRKARQCYTGTLLYTVQPQTNLVGIYCLKEYICT